jgi:hypothetical protein
MCHNALKMRFLEHWYILGKPNNLLFNTSFMQETFLISKFVFYFKWKSAIIIKQGNEAEFTLIIFTDFFFRFCDLDMCKLYTFVKPNGLTIH